VHDRLGEPVGYFPRNQEELEETADARVPNGWNQGKIVVTLLDNHNFLHGVQRD